MTRVASPMGTSALYVQATPQSALRQDALSGGSAALPTMALGSDKTSANLVMAAVSSTQRFGTAPTYFSQVHGGNAADLHYITSPEVLMNLLAGFASIEHFVLLSHAFDDDIALGTASKTPAQLRDLLKPVMPRVARMTIDGCSAGRGAVQLFDMAEGLAIGELRAWSYFHHLEVWGRPARQEDNPDPNEDLAAVLAFAEPYIPQGASGSRIPASRLLAEYGSNGTFAVITEFFTYNLEPDLEFETLTHRVTQPGPTGPPPPDPWTKVRLPSEAEYPRSACETITITSRNGAEIAADRTSAHEATPFQVVIRP